MARAHPRAGGENSARAAAIGPLLGSSPRGRGKPRGRGCGAGVCGLIPARAGKTFARSIRSTSGRAHPRAGGENPLRTELRVKYTGSSPRGRGKPAAANDASAPVGLIPARAGKTRTPHAPSPRHRAHPRAGGENVWERVALGEAVGSSPRGRGKPAVSCPYEAAYGLLPARAGKTSERARDVALHEAHPRAGGENPRRQSRRTRGRGSSPRGRGKLWVWVCAGGCGRLIPARAGKTGLRVQAGTAQPAHPRAGGENLATVNDCPTASGSSPRGRGKRKRLWAGA